MVNRLLRDVPTDNASTLKHGYMPKLSGNTSTFFSGDGTERVPSGTGLSIALANGKIWLGNGTGVAVQVTPSGDWTTDNAGVNVIGAAKVGVAKMTASATNVVFGRSSAGAGAGQEIACTAAGRALLDDADAAAQRTTLGLGTIATENAGASGSFMTVDLKTVTVTNGLITAIV